MNARLPFFLRGLAVLLFFTFPALLHAATLNVPSAAYPTIQSGVDAAHDGDTVLVADGTYTGNGNRDIDFHGKSLTVTSQNGPAKTIIDCGGFYSGDGSGSHRGFYIHSNETAATISGFNVQNGYGFSGGGIYNNGGQLAITNCIISSNRAIYGGGVCSNGGSVVLTNSDISLNTGQDAGGGIQADHAIINNCNIVGNKAIYSAVKAFGGGLQVGESTVINCVIKGNKSNFAGGIDARSCVVKGCTIIDNTAVENAYGGIFAIEDTIADCVISRNTSQYGSSGIEANGKTTIANCEVTENTGYNVYGGPSSGISCTGDVSVTNCTVTSNATDYGIHFIGSTVVVTNCILYNDRHAEVYNDPSNQDAITVSHSDIQGGYPGTSNIDKDPLFVNGPAGDLHLQPGSPCIGAGTPNGAPPTDLDGNPRPNPPSIGAYELGVPPATITGFILSPNQIAAPGPDVTANVSVTGNFTKVTVSPAPGSLSSASPTFTLLTNSGGGWGGSFPTAFLKLAKTNPVTFIATGTRTDGSTVTATAALQIGSVPALTFSLLPDQSAVRRNQTFNLKGFVNDLTTVPASNATMQIILPTGINYVSSNGFTYNASTSTLTLAVPPLSANGGYYPVLVTLQVASDALKPAVLVMPTSVVCKGFKQADQYPAISVESGLVPVGVQVDATEGYGILDGTAQVHDNLGNSPLSATLTPTTSLNNVLKLFGDTHRLSIWTEVTVKTFGNATCEPGGDSAAAYLAQVGLMSPSVSPSYNATFQKITDSVRVSVSFTPRSAGLTLMDAFLTALAVRLHKPTPTADQVFSIWSDVSQLSAFASGVNAFTQHPPKNLFQFYQDIANADKALLNISGPEKQLLINSLKKHGVIDDFDAVNINTVQGIFSDVFSANSLIHMYGDWVMLQFATSGQPMVVYFNASPLKIQQNQSAKGKDSVSKIATRN